MTEAKPKLPSVVVMDRAAFLKFARRLEDIEHERDELCAEVETLRDTATLREKVIMQYLKTIEDLRQALQIALDRQNRA